MRLHRICGVRFRSHLRSYARAYAYRGLTAFASLSMAVSVCATSLPSPTSDSPTIVLLITGISVSPYLLLRVNFVSPPLPGGNRGHG
ncbi:MAG: hypothetical protein ABW087_16840 [Candidatus Thiodiazotropha sp.]